MRPIVPRAALRWQVSGVSGIRPTAAESRDWRQVDLRREFNEVGIGDVLDQLDRQ